MTFIDLVEFPFEVLFEVAPMFEYMVLPLSCFGIFLGGIYIIKELFRFV